MRTAGTSATVKNRGRRREIALLVAAAAAGFFALSLLSYHGWDPSPFVETAREPRNFGGRVGAWSAALLLETLGVGALWIPLGLAMTAAALYRGESGRRLAALVAGIGANAIVIAVFLALQWSRVRWGGDELRTGGALGEWAARLLLQQFNSGGATLVAGVGVAVLLVATTPVSVAALGVTLARIGGEISWRIMRLLGATTLAAGAHGFVAGTDLARAAYRGLRAARAPAVAELEIERHPTIRAVAAPVRPSRLAPLLARLHAWRARRESDRVAAPVVAPSAPPKVEIQEAAPQEVERTEVRAPSTAARPMIPAELPFEVIPAAAASEESVPAARPAPSAARSAASALERIAQAAKRGPKRAAWKLPPVDFLKRPTRIDSSVDRERLLENSKILEKTFGDFGIEGNVTAVRPGPVITLYEFKPGPGVKVSRIAALADDISMALSAQSVRILAPLPGKPVVGIEIPSENRETVYMREFLNNADFFGPRHQIPVIMGKDIAGQTYLSDLARMPHLLVAGQTGSGKSVFMNGLICSLFYRFTPDELRMILVDPKFIEFRAYQDIPHLLLPVVDDPGQAAIALRWAVREMERRYRILAKLNARNLQAYNQKIDELGVDVVRDLLFAEENQEEDAAPSRARSSGSDWIEAFEPDEGGSPRVGKLPTIVIIIDELADLMMVAKKDVEVSIARIAQKARAAGIHLVIATQRPSTDVVTGLIKANLPSRVSFRLASFIDSKTILDGSGAERLLGQGDMLFIPPGTSQQLRLHGALVDDPEIEKITAFLKEQGKPAYRDEILIDETAEEEESGGDVQDEKFDEAVELVKKAGHASASFLQRHLKVGYNRAARMIEEMEIRGIVGEAEGSKPREVLVR